MLCFCLLFLCETNWSWPHKNTKTNLVLTITKNIAFYFHFSPLEELIYKRDRIIWDPVTDARISPHDSPCDLQSVLDVQHKKRICPIGDGSLDFALIDEVNLWGLEDYAKAGKLLHKPPIHVDFIDEHEMRKVYSLIYDVFRCKYRLIGTNKQELWRDTRKNDKKLIYFAVSRVYSIFVCIWHEGDKVCHLNLNQLYVFKRIILEFYIKNMLKISFMNILQC